MLEACARVIPATATAEAEIEAAAAEVAATQTAAAVEFFGLWYRDTLV